MFKDRKLIGRIRGTDVPVSGHKSNTGKGDYRETHFCLVKCRGRNGEKTLKAQHSFNKFNCSLPKHKRNTKFERAEVNSMKEMKKRGSLALYFLIRRYEFITRAFHVSHLA